MIHLAAHLISRLTIAFVPVALWTTIAAGQSSSRNPTPYQMYYGGRGTTGSIPKSAGLLESAPALSGPQALSVDDIKNQLKQQAMGMLRGCDYGQYLNLATSMGQAWDFYKKAGDVDTDKRWAFPLMDVIQAFVNFGGVYAAKESAEAEREGLIYQLEQVCNAVVQADEINRQYQLVRAGSMNIGNALNWLLGEVNLGYNKVPGADRGRLVADWGRVYENLVPRSGNPEADTLYAAINGTLKESLAASNDIAEALDKIHVDLAKLKEELFLVADWDDKAKKWSCPEGYPDPNRTNPPPEKLKGKPICGPASPERSTQLTAHFEAITTQIRATEIAIDARALEVEAIRLMADNQERREQRHAAITAIKIF